MMTKLTTSEFKEKIFDFDANQDWQFNGDLPAIIEFYADWCPPCKMVAPILDAIADEYAGKLRVYKVNSDEETDIAQAFGVSSIPTILFIPKDGQPRMSVGALPRPSILKAMNEVMQVN